MKIIRAKYLIKCDVPGCNSVSKNMYSQKDSLSTTGLAICDKCIKELASKTKNTRSSYEKENRKEN